MQTWKTVYTFTFPQEAHVAKLNLEGTGIECHLKDELTIQADNFISNAIGGVKLQVMEADWSRAHNLLLETGQIKEHASDNQPGPFDLYTAKLPFIKQFPPEIRLLIVAGIVLLIIALPFLFIL